MRDSTALFERVSLEAFQSGLSWLIILRKRENFLRAFHRFDIDRVARYTDRDIARLMDDAGIVRNRSKIEATIANARGRRLGRRPRRAALVIRAAAASTARRPVPGSCGHAGFDGDGEGTEASRLQIRGSDNGLR